MNADTTITKTIRIDKTEAQEWERLLAMDHVDFDEEDVETAASLATYSIGVADNSVVEIVVQSGQNNLWVDGIFLQDGIEVCVAQPSESLLGEYWFWIDEKCYLIEVTTED